MSRLPGKTFESSWSNLRANVGFAFGEKPQPRKLEGYHLLPAEIQLYELPYRQHVFCLIGFFIEDVKKVTIINLS